MITPEPSIYEIFWQIFELKADMMRCNPRFSSPKILMMKFFYEAENYINVEDDASDRIFNKDEVVERDPCAMTKTWVWMQSQLAATNRPTAAQPRKKLTWEIYSGTGLLGETAELMGAEVMRFGLHNGWDLTKSSHRRQLLQMADELEPDEIYVSKMHLVEPNASHQHPQRCGLAGPSRATAL